MPRTFLPILTLALVLLVGTAAPAPATPSGSLDSKLPWTFWGYETLNSFANQGLFWGSEDFAAKPHALYTRRDFAKYTAELMATLEPIVGVGGPLPERRHSFLYGLGAVTRLLRSFAPEMWQIGIDPEWGYSTAERVEEFRRTGRPTGVTTPLPSLNRGQVFDDDIMARRYNLELREFGARSAREAWARSDHRLLTLRPLPNVRLALPTAVRWQTVPAELKPAQREQFARGYNETMWRLVRERGTPLPPDQTWLTTVTNPRRAWRTGRKQRVRLDDKHPTTTVPEFGVQLSRNPTDNHGILLTLRDEDGATVPQGDIWLPLAGKSLDLVWGPPRSGIYLVRTRVKNDREMPHRIYVIDLGSGAVLNAVAAP